MAISIVVKTTPVPPSPWTSIFDNTKWDGSTWTGGPGSSFNWDGSGWVGVAPNGSGELLPIGDWYLGYRPTQMRLTFTTQTAPGGVPQPDAPLGFYWLYGTATIIQSSFDDVYTGDIETGAGHDSDIAWYSINYSNIHGAGNTIRITNIELYQAL